MAVTTAPLIIRRLTAAEARERVGDLTDILVDCVEGGASVGFMAPLARERAASFWRRVADGVASGERILLLAEEDGRAMGTVQVLPAAFDNQPHRADIAKMLVMRSARRRGVGGALMRAAEEEALGTGRHVLVLDTVPGSDAERLYRRMGWVPVGVVPDFALMPDGRPCDTCFFYKRLSPPAGASA